MNKERIMRKKHAGVLAIVSLLCLLMFAPAVPAKAAVRLSASKLTLIKGQSKTLKVKGTTKKAVWGTSKKKVATVKNGKVTARKRGKATITAKISGRTLKCKVTVVTPKLSATKLSVQKGGSKKLKIKGTTAKVKWSSSNTSVATVKKGVVTGRKNGSAVITAKVLGKKYTCKVTVSTIAFTKKTWRYNDKVSITMKVPDGWDYSVSQVNSSVCEPIVTVYSKAEPNLSMKFSYDVIMMKSYAAHMQQVNTIALGHEYLAALDWLVPVTGYASDGKDAAGVFMGLYSNKNYVKTPTVAKKVSSYSYSSSGNTLTIETLHTTWTHTNGKQYLCMFASCKPSFEVSPGIVTAFNVVELNAPAPDFEEMLPYLMEIYGSLEFSQGLLDLHADLANETAQNASAYYKEQSARSEKMVNDFLDYLHN